MISRRLSFLLILLLSGVSAGAAETFAAATQRAAADYSQRLRQAADELARTRTRVGDEKAPFVDQLRAVEDRIITAENQTRQLETAQAASADQRTRLLRDQEGLRRTGVYLDTLVQESAKIFRESLAPGEEQVVADRMQALQQKIDEHARPAGPQPGLDLADYLLDRIELAVGGYAAPGNAIVANGSQVLKGTFVFAGPSSYFHAGDGGIAGPAWTRGGVAIPVVYPPPAWQPAEMEAFFAGRPGAIPLDITDGKALRLKETRGTVLSHIDAGGPVAYLIIGVGILSLLLIGQKIMDTGRMRQDSPEKVRAFLAVVARGSPAEMTAALSTLRGTTRELFAIGVEHVERPKDILEEHLESALLRYRLHYERRLPLLAVIATASPLLGLLGTVVGMVKTFALITVFGTGNAGKLASGISQVLVATELGLVVAIPTLIAHGFLTHRIHKNLALLERYALEFVTAATTARIGREVPAEARVLPA